MREKWGNESIALRHPKSKLKFLATEGDDRYSVCVLHLCALTDQTKQDRNESVSSASRKAPSTGRSLRVACLSRLLNNSVCIAKAVKLNSTYEYVCGVSIPLLGAYHMLLS